MMATVFISYSHEDIPLREELESYLRILALNEDAVDLEVWSDERLRAGDSWETSIDAIMERASIVLLLVTQSFLSSEFIRKKELPYLEARARRHALKIIPVLAEHCPWDMVPALRTRQLHPASGRPLASLSSNDRKEELTKLLHQIGDLLANGSPPIVAPLPIVAPTKNGTLTDSGRVPVATSGEGATLQVSLRHHRAAQYYIAEVRYSDPRSSRNDRELISTVHLGPSAVSASPVDAIAYASELERCLFPVGPVQEVVKKAIDDSDGRTLTLRVSIDPTASDLHCVRWEALPYSPLFAAAPKPAEIIFTRYVSPGEETWTKPWIRSRPRIGVLLLDYRLKPRPEEHEAYAARFESLGLGCTRLAADSPVTALDSLESVIALVATDLTPDAFAPSLSWPNDQGQATLRPAGEAVAAFRRHLGGAQVVILATSPADAEDGEPAGWSRGALSLAADLAATGFCAVVTRGAGLEAVHWERYLELFLAALKSTGNIDQATHEARTGLPDEEAWKPAVFTRVRTGRIWREPRFVGKGDSSWDLIVERTRKGTVVPILGPGVSDYLLRSREEIAQEMADLCHFPLARSERSKLRKVAQYIATTQEPARPISQFLDAVRSYMTERYGNSIPGLSHDDEVGENLDRIWQGSLAKRADDPYRLVARMGARVYLTTAFHPFLSLAIRDHHQNGSAKKEAGPRDRILSLDRGILDAEADCDELGLTLDRQQPLIYYLFGRVDHPKSLVLTEDDHFRFLLDFKEQWRSLPGTVIDALSDSALLFLGFDLNGWDFRAIFRAILELEGSDQLRKIPHVAVQVNPDDDKFADPERTQAYLVEYFTQISEKPLVFLGSTHDFLSELDRRCSP